MGQCLARLDRERSRSLPFIGVIDPNKTRANSKVSQPGGLAVKKFSSMLRDGYGSHEDSATTSTAPAKNQRALVARRNYEYRSSPALSTNSSSHAANDPDRSGGMPHERQRLHNSNSLSTNYGYSYHSSPVVEHHPRGGKRHRMVVGIYSYENRVDGDIGFNKGDIMTLIDDSNSDWWYVKHPSNGLGYVPRNFLAMVDSLESEEWYAGKATRNAAEKLVLASNLPRGTFLVRRRGDIGENEFALTINDSRGGEYDVKHYKVRPLDNGSGYYITTKRVFPTIRDMVDFYSVDANGLCSRLTFPAPRIAPVRPDLSYETQKNWEIPRDELQFIKKLGDGNFGEVWLGSWRGCVEVAIKTMKTVQGNSSMTMEAFLAEAHIMKAITHPKLVKLYAVCTTCDPLFIVTEYMVNGSLLQYLRRNGSTGLTLQALVDMAAQVANGMTYLEGRKLVHRDLAARNILVGEVISGIPDVKVADFGLARRLVEEGAYEAQSGAKFPIKWTAPEAAQRGNFTTKSDVWSYGVLLYEIFTFGHTPYPGMQNREVIEEVERGYRMPRPASVPPAIYEAMLKCWARCADERPTFSFLYSFFDDFFVAAQPNYVPPSLDGTIDAMDEEESGR